MFLIYFLSIFEKTIKLLYYRISFPTIHNSNLIFCYKCYKTVDLIYYIWHLKSKKYKLKFKTLFLILFQWLSAYNLLVYLSTVAS